MAAKKKVEKEERIIEIPRQKLVEEEVTVIGESSFISHQWARKAAKEHYDKITGFGPVKTGPRDKRDPVQDYLESLYWLTGMPMNPTLADLDGARFGFPSVAIKKSMLDAAAEIDGLNKTTIKRKIYIPGELIEIIGRPRPREDNVRLAPPSRKADLRWRAEFPEWAMKFNIVYDSAHFSSEQVHLLIDLGGSECGIGDWRPQCDGIHGRFHVRRKGEKMPKVRDWQIPTDMIASEYFYQKLAECKAAA